MATDVSLSHTIDDDIMFERVRHLPRRTQFVSTHRKLSWQYDREVRQHERDQKITHVEMSRAKIAMAEKLSRLQDAKKEVARKKNDPDSGLPRRCSAPCLPDIARTKRKESTKMAANNMKHSHSASSFPEIASIPEDRETTASDDTQDQLVNENFEEKDTKKSGKAGRRATVAEGAAERFSLPSHLVHRLSLFMDSTSSLLLNAPSNGNSRGGKRPETTPSAKSDSVSESTSIKETEEEPQTEQV